METVELLDKYFETAFAAPDGIKRLRELILTLAMQGKLVPQNPKDRPASELLKEIEAEKKRLIKEKKIKKSKPLPEITPDEIPYYLPDSWEWVRLGNLAIFENGDRSNRYPNEKDIQTTGIPFFGAKDMVNGILSFDNELRFISESKFLELSSGKLIDKDFVVLLRGTVGKTAIFSANYKFSTGFINAQMLIIRLLNKKLCDFFKIYTDSTTFQALITSKTTGSAVKQMPASKVFDFLFPFPPLEEQHRIVEKIDRLMEQVDRLEKLQKERDRKQLNIHAAASDRLLNAPNKNSFNDAWYFIQNNFNQLYSVKENISELRKAILQLAVMGKLVPQNPNDPPASELLKEIEAEKKRLIKEGKIKNQKPLPEIKPEEIPDKIPTNWKWNRLEDIVEIITGVSKGKKYKSQEMMSFPYLRVANVQRGYLDLKIIKYLEIPVNEFSRYEVLKNDLLITEGGDWDKVGRTAIWKSEIPSCIHQNHIFKGRRFLNEPNVYWLQIYLNSPTARNYFAGASKQTTNLASINKTQLRSCLIPLPPLPEQHRIVAKVDRLMALCDQLEAQLTKQTEKQTALLNEVIAAI